MRKRMKARTGTTPVTTDYPEDSSLPSSETRPTLDIYAQQVEVTEQMGEEH